MRTLLGTGAGRLVIGLLGILAVATVIGIAVLWPSGEAGDDLGAGLAGDTDGAEVTAVRSVACPGQPGEICSAIEVRLLDGSNAGDSASIDLGSGGSGPEISVGDKVRVAASVGAPGALTAYSLSDFERRAPMLWLTLIFAGLVILFGRLRGALSLVGLVGSLAVVMIFIVPAIRDGESALAVALFGSLGVMLVTIALAHGLGAKSLAAMLGTALSLIFVVLLASLFTHLTHLTGFSSEEAAILAVNGSDISLQGLLLAGMVIGALGVLDDVTISQASTVMALRAANPGLAFAELYRRAIDVGRDHISATVNTLVLAYVGSSLPVLLIFSSGSIGFLDAANVELVAKEIVAMLVGSIGLIAAVPLTTALAAVLAVRLPVKALADDQHAHVH